MKIVVGNLITLAEKGEFDIIIHGCNSHNTMGAGLAKEIRQKYHDAYRADCRTKAGDKSKLGTYTFANVVSKFDNVTKFTIINAYTQYDYSGKGVLADYKAIAKVFRSIKNDFTGKRIGYPLIGAGLARGDWDFISKIINAELEGEDHTLVKFLKFEK